MTSRQIPIGRFYFSFLERLGAGGLGFVHRVRVEHTNAPDKPVGSEWACKRLNPEWNAHPQMRIRFDREIAALQTMSHPNIVTFEGENLPDDGERFYLMPLFGNTLRRYVASAKSRGNWRYFAGLAITLAEAMQYAHDRGFIHRDLKPDNILFNANGPLVIADWGLGYFVHRESKVLQHLTRGGMGTEYYCSLEQWSTGKCDGRGDIYALGMLLDECITGAQRAITVGVGINGPTTSDAGVGARAFNELLKRMTQPFAAARPNTMRDVADALRFALSI